MVSWVTFGSIIVSYHTTFMSKMTTAKINFILTLICLMDEFWHMVDHLKCIFYMTLFQHVVVVQYTKQCFYWIPHPRKYVCRHQNMYPTLTGTGDIPR